jgi:hypothetical protein
MSPSPFLSYSIIILIDIFTNPVKSDHVPI